MSPLAAMRWFLAAAVVAALVWAAVSALVDQHGYPGERLPLRSPSPAMSHLCPDGQAYPGFEGPCPTMPPR